MLREALHFRLDLLNRREMEEPSADLEGAQQYLIRSQQMEAVEVPS